MGDGFDTYEDYLDSFVTEKDLFYLEVRPPYPFFGRKPFSEPFFAVSFRTKKWPGVS